MQQNIYEYIENFELEEDKFLEFVQALGQYFSDKMGVRACPIKITELKPMDTCAGSVPPAKYGFMARRSSNRLMGQSNPVRFDEWIEFRPDIAKEKNKARIVKLISHEWMHFYDALFGWKELDISQSDEKYRELILKSQQYHKNYDSVREKYPDVHIFSMIDKLSAKEVVADTFAQDFLKELLENVSTDKLKKQIEKQIEKHTDQIQFYIKELEGIEIEDGLLVL